MGGALLLLHLQVPSALWDCRRRHLPRPRPRHEIGGPELASDGHVHGRFVVLREHVRRSVLMRLSSLSYSSLTRKSRNLPRACALSKPNLSPSFRYMVYLLSIPVSVYNLYLPGYFPLCVSDFDLRPRVNYHLYTVASKVCFRSSLQHTLTI